MRQPGALPARLFMFDWHGCIFAFKIQSMAEVIQIPRRTLHDEVALHVAPAADVGQALAARLRRETVGEVLFDDGSRGRYATDASIYQIMPVGVFVPKSEGDIAAAIAIARELRVPVLARGAGTSQCGQTTGAALVIDNSKYFCNVLEVDVAARTATVEPGLVLDRLNDQLKPHELGFP